MSRQLLVGPAAVSDVREAALWYEDKRPGLGAELVLEIDAVYDRIVENPTQFPKISLGVRRALLRRFPYSVYFLIGEGVLEIVGVLHQHRRPDTWRRRT